MMRMIAIAGIIETLINTQDPNTKRHRKLDHIPNTFHPKTQRNQAQRSIVNAL